MRFSYIERLKREYTDRYVVVCGDRPELARFAGAVGQVRTVNFNGRALVEFDQYGDRGRYDIALDYLKFVEKPEPKPEPVKAKPAPKPKPAAASEPTAGTKSDEGQA